MRQQTFRLQAPKTWIEKISSYPLFRTPLIQMPASTPTANNLMTNLVMAATAGLVVILILLLIPVFRRKRLFERIPPVSILLERSFKRVGLRPPAFIGFLAYKASLSPIAKSYMEISLALARLGQRPAPSDTPKERTEQSEDRDPDRATRSRLRCYVSTS